MRATDSAGTRSGLLVQLRDLDDVLDRLLLGPSLFIVAPPHGALVFAFQLEVLASLAQRFSFITLLSPKPTGEAT